MLVLILVINRTMLVPILVPKYTMLKLILVVEDTVLVPILARKDTSSSSSSA